MAAKNMGQFVTESAKFLLCPVVNVELDLEDVFRDPPGMASFHDPFIKLDDV